MKDRIEKLVELDAPVARVWRALTDHKEFGKWFRADLESPFASGKTSRGQITFPGYEHLSLEFDVEKMEEPRLFSMRWHPYAVEPDADYSDEAPTLIEFTLEKRGSGTLLTITETGFEALPEERREEAFEMNSGGWSAQMQNIENYLKNNP